MAGPLWTQLNGSTENCEGQALAASSPSELLVRSYYSRLTNTLSNHNKNKDYDGRSTDAVKDRPRFGGPGRAFYVFNNSFNKYLLSTCYAPGTDLDAMNEISN